MPSTRAFDDSAPGRHRRRAKDSSCTVRTNYLYNAKELSEPEPRLTPETSVNAMLLKRPSAPSSSRDVARRPAPP